MSPKESIIARTKKRKEKYLEFLPYNELISRSCILFTRWIQQICSKVLDDEAGLIISGWLQFAGTKWSGGLPLTIHDALLGLGDPEREDHNIFIKDYCSILFVDCSHCHKFQNI